MSENDPLSRMLGSLRRKREGENLDDIDFGTQPKSEGDKGLNPLDLLALPSAQRDLINFVSRKKEASLDEITDKLKLPDEELLHAVKELVETGYLHQVLLDGLLHYRVVFGGKVKRAGHSVPQAIWDAVDLDNAVFLRQVPLFEHLTDEQRHQIAANITSRRYKRNEIILWQGHVGDGIYLIKSGIVGISRLTPDERDNDATETLAYLKQGDILGEHNLSAQHNLAASATATAMSEVEVLIMRREDFLSVLTDYESTALRLAQMLSSRLINLNTRLSTKGADVKLSLIFDVSDGIAKTVGPVLAMTLAQLTERQSVYTEHPSPAELLSRFGFDDSTEIYTHNAGFDIAAIEGTVGLPPSVRTTLVVDSLFNDYANVVIGLPDRVEESMVYMLEKARQVVIVADTTEDERVQKLLSNLRSHIHPERTSVIVVANYAGSDATAPKFYTDFEIQYVDGLPAVADMRSENLPPAIYDTIKQLSDRLGRTNQLGVYIPTTVDVDTVVDTSVYIDRTKEFLGKTFGGVNATSNSAYGVWNSEDVGLVGEDIYIVRAFVTQAELDRYLGDVLEYVEGLKLELSQEAMAVEVNQKLMLI